MHALVEDGKVIEVGVLPSTWQRSDGTTVSGYDTLPSDEHAKDGWLPFDDQRPALAKHEVWGETVYTVANGRVTATASKSTDQRSVNDEILRAGLAQLLTERANAKATIAAGRNTLTPVRGRAAQPATAAGLLQVQNDLKTVANALDGLAAIDVRVIDWLAQVGRLVVGDLTDT